MSLFDPEYLISIFLVFVRVGGLFIAAPVFNHPSIPVRLRVLLAVVLAYSMVGLVPSAPPPTVLTSIGLAVAVMSEAVTGLLLGFTAQFIFYGMQFAGELIGFQMGLSLAQAYDPVNGESMNHLGRFLIMCMTMVFLLSDGHHLLLLAVAGSFQVVPLASANLAAPAPQLLHQAAGIFSTAIKMASPFMITIFVLDVALGVFARVVPQADLFSLALPLKLLVGLLLSYFFLNTLFPAIPVMVDVMVEDLLHVIQALIPG